jgi:hypothetical protein
MTEKPFVDQSPAADSTSGDRSRCHSPASENHDTADVAGSQLRILRMLAEAVAAAFREEMRSNQAAAPPLQQVDGAGPD